MADIDPANFHPLAREAVFAHGAQQKVQELSALVRLLECVEPLKRVLEIGSQHGGTLWLWSRLMMSGGKLAAIDIDFRQLAVPLGLKEGIRLKKIEGDSHDPRRRTQVIEWLGYDNPECLDLLFIDGDHTYQGVRCDLLDYVHMVRPGGWIILHDVHENGDSNCQVRKAWLELTAGYGDEIIFPHSVDTQHGLLPASSCGIGVVRV